MNTAIERVKAECGRRYPNPEVADAVLQDAVRLGTIDAIDQGTRVLPSPQDAIHWHERMTGKSAAAKTESDNSSRLADALKRIEALEYELAIPSERIGHPTGTTEPPQPTDR